MFRWHGLQRPDFDSVDDWILNQYDEMYQAFFEQKSLIPTGRMYELSFEHLEQDPIGEVYKVYQTLQLPDFSVAEAKLRAYLKSLEGYQQNTFSELPPQ